jgi:hypothetical protein
MSRLHPARRRAAANVRVGVGTKFAYDGETVTILEMFPAGRGNEVLVEDRGGKRRYCPPHRRRQDKSRNHALHKEMHRPRDLPRHAAHTPRNPYSNPCHNIAVSEIETAAERLADLPVVRDGSVSFSITEITEVRFR